MSRRTGLGRGLGAFFGDDYEAPIKKEKTPASQQEKSEQDNSEPTISKERINDIKEDAEAKNKNMDPENRDLGNKDPENKALGNKDPENRDLENKAPESMDFENRTPENKDLGNRDPKNKDPENEDLENRDSESKALGNSALENKDQKNKNPEKKELETGNPAGDSMNKSSYENAGAKGKEPVSPSVMRRHNLEELDMVLPTASKRKTDNKGTKNARTANKPTGKTGSGKAAAVKTVEKIKIVEVEKEKFLNISLIEPNREQPRKDFDEEQLNELADSIKVYGVLQPLLVQKKGDYYEIIAGERRWRAAKLAGLREVPVVVREYSKQQSMEIALIENVQRADLNPIEEARAYQMLVQEFGLKQEEVAERVSKNRATITNSMRLLKLDYRVQDMLIQNQISGGHARTLLGLEDKEQQYLIALKIVQNQLSVRELEKLVKTLTSEPKKKKEPKEEERDLKIFYQDLEEKLKSVMGTKVIINKKDKNKGRIEIEYYSSAELERIAELLQSIQL